MILLWMNPAKPSARLNGSPLRSPVLLPSCTGLATDPPGKFSLSPGAGRSFPRSGDPAPLQASRQPKSIVY